MNSDHSMSVVFMLFFNLKILTRPKFSEFTTFCNYLTRGGKFFAQISAKYTFNPSNDFDSSSISPNVLSMVSKMLHITDPLIMFKVELSKQSTGIFNKNELVYL